MDSYSFFKNLHLNIFTIFVLSVKSTGCHFGLPGLAYDLFAMEDHTTGTKPRDNTARRIMSAFKPFHQDKVAFREGVDQNLNI